MFFRDLSLYQAWISSGHQKGNSFAQKRKTQDSPYNTIHPERLIPQWPQEIAERSRIGDWEGDTVYGAVGKGLLVILVDRKSGCLCAGLIRSRNAELTCDMIHTLLKDIPVSNISLDNGSEFADFKRLEQLLHAPVYFAEPHKP